VKIATVVVLPEQQIDVVMIEEVKLIVAEQIGIVHQYFKVNETSECECSSKVALLKKKLADSKEAIKHLSHQLELMNKKHRLLDASDHAISLYATLQS